MRKSNGKVWLILGVLAALSISGGIVYAYTTHNSGVKMNNYGIGMNTAPEDNDMLIIWPANQQVEAAYVHPDVWINVKALANYSNRDAWSLLFAYNNHYDSTHHEKASVEAGPNGTAIGSYVKSGGVFDLQAEVRATYDGDVVITLGD